MATYQDRQREISDLFHFCLDEQAKEKDHRCAHWFGRRGGSRRRTWKCNLCGMVIATESAEYPITRRSLRAIREHRLLHLDELGLSEESNLNQNPEEWLKEAFEYEFCDECLGDALHHTAVPFMGNWFGRCDYPFDEETGEMHPRLREYHTLAGNFDIFDA